MSSFALLEMSMLPNVTLNLTAIPIHEPDAFASPGFWIVLLLSLLYVGTAMLSCRRLLLRSDALLFKAIEPLPPSIAVTRPRSASSVSSFSSVGYQAGTASHRSSQYGGVNNSFARGGMDPRSSEFSNASVSKPEQHLGPGSSHPLGGGGGAPSTQNAMTNASLGPASGKKPDSSSFSSQPPLISPRNGSRTPRGSARQAPFRSHTVRILLSEALSLHPEERWEEVAQNAVAGLPADGIIAFYVLIVSYCIVATIFLLTNNLILTAAVARDRELWDSSHGGAASSSSSSSAYADSLIDVQGKLQNVFSGIVAMLLFNVCLLLLLRLFSVTDPVAVGRSSRAIKIRQYGLLLLMNVLCLSAMIEIMIGSTSQELPTSAWVLYSNTVFSVTPFLLCLGGIFVGIYVPWYMTKRLESGESWAGSCRVRAAAAASSFGLFCHAFFIFPPVQDHLFLSLQDSPLSFNAILLSIDLLPVLTSVIILAASSNDSAAAGGPSSSGGTGPGPASRPLLNRSFAEMEATHPPREA